MIGFADNMVTLSAYVNDEGYEQVFSQQLANSVQPDNVVIGISTSGNSPNVLEAIKLANQMSAVTIGLTGFDGGQLSQMVKINVHAPSDRIDQVEDLHLMLQHLSMYGIASVDPKDHITSERESGRHSLSLR